MTYGESQKLWEHPCSRYRLWSAFRCYLNVHFFKMIKDIAQHNQEIKGNERVIDILHRDFPQCFTHDGKFDMDVFKEHIGEFVPTTNEGYSLQFLGKSYASLVAATDTTTVMVPDEAHNSKPENINSQNIYISGDNLDALKHLRNSYSEAIKCIYIDPPYNTGKDGFVYNDKFNYTTEQLQAKLGISEKASQRIIDMTTIGSTSHSAWLAFMFPRLLLAKDLLTKDGVIFISIDDNEQANLKLLCDTIFGEENCLGVFPRITKRGGKSSDVIALNHDYLLIYSNGNPTLYPLEHNDAGFKFQDEFFNERGLYKLNQTLDYDSLQYSDSLDYPIYLDNLTFYTGGYEEEYQNRKDGNHDRADWCWRWSKDKFKFGLDNGFVVVKHTKNGSRIYTKTYQKATIEDGDNGYFVDYGDRTKSISTLQLTDNLFSNDNATKDIAQTIGKKIFDYTKPISLIQFILDLSVRKGDTMLDFFSGSATTAEAVMKWNVETQNEIQFIMVQIPEPVKDNTTAKKAGFNTIDEIGQERIKRAAKNITNKNPLFAGDLGFKHYTLVEPSDQTFAKLEDFNPNAFFADNILEEFGIDTILCTWALRDGYGLNAEIEPIDLNGYKAFLCGRHLYFINPGLTNETGPDALVALIEKFNNDKAFKPENIVLFGYSFTYTETEALKKNLTPIRDGIKNLKVNLDIRY